ncbi:ADP-glyceromanno-heptose 6-epimerase [Sulfidibacter corallicola]|uniref:ADP-L-glycero-D-manno-heptose-6-epimerase n=1 Tax=Sulfidibacter corallicola TaxID=2818388 RepID=A0A8A4TMG3_SULCO|nr:ADP-glyceromanno-heptose 6-epimerase [Sulfidibacter corallicola]QTD47785.1 ADP-glyceromanno-heptose 6-epimerase [Sulfidibacter corallicola]
MIIVTGGSGFIGSCMVSKLNQLGRSDIIVTDVLRTTDKWKNLRHLAYHDYLDRSQLLDFLGNAPKIDAIFHMGACSATTERDADYLMDNNYRYTLRLAQWAMANDVRFVYASSAATYGAGEMGYADDEAEIHRLRPLNMYGYSKQLFDLKARREGWFDKIAGLKFFNVYGPNEYFKGDMVSVVFKAFNQIRADGVVKLFKSHRPDFVDGGQQRDFVYVKDVVEVMAWLFENPKVNGLFNLGTGEARNFRDLVSAAFRALDLEPNIEFIDMPEHLRDRYQYFTQAEMEKLREAGYDKPFHTLEQGVTDYVQDYLNRDFAHY